MNRPKKLISVVLLLAMAFQLTACGTTGNTSSSTLNGAVGSNSGNSGINYATSTPEEICASLTIEEKAAQMVQGAVYALYPFNMESDDYGSVLSTFGGWPAYTYDQWLDTVNEYQANALASDAGIPFIYGNDSVHGVNTADGTVIYPHNINIGAANDIELTQEMGALVGSDMLYTGMRWTFSPCVACATDPRWGRTFESYSSETSIVTPLAVAFTEGIMSQGILACAKHYLGDGNVLFGTGDSSDGVERLIDRGDAQLNEEQIQELLDVYQALVDTGVQTVMISHSSLNGIKMHENEEYISILKNELGFEGIVISDWDSIHNCSGSSLKENVIICINAGIDMLMEAEAYGECRQYIVEGFNEGLISEDRINDAVIRILTVKQNMGLFEDPYGENITPAYEWNSARGHEVARTLAAESLVPIKLDGDVTLEAGMRVFVTGPASNDVGALCGGWTYTWEGSTDASTGGMPWCSEGVSILEALQTAADEYGFEIVTDENEISSCDVVILCIGEIPYAEWNGDTDDLSLVGDLGLSGNQEAIDLAANSGIPTTTLIIAGRNVIIEDYIDQWDNIIMCYLPGSEGGNGIADVLTGTVPFSGTLPMPYYSSVEQIGTDELWLPVGFSAAET